MTTTPFLVFTDTSGIGRGRRQELDLIVKMGRTSSAVKDKYNAKTYDSIMLRVFKGEKIKHHAEDRGESVNGFIVRAISEQMKRDAE